MLQTTSDINAALKADHCVWCKGCRLLEPVDEPSSTSAEWLVSRLDMLKCCFRFEMGRQGRTFNCNKERETLFQLGSPLLWALRWLLNGFTESSAEVVLKVLQLNRTTIGSVFYRNETCIEFTSKVVPGQA